MRILIVYASRYGSTKTICEWIKERLLLEGINTDMHQAKDAPSAGGYDAVILGAGVYGHKLLTELDGYILSNTETLNRTKTAVFGAAMRTETFFRAGRPYGGTVMLQKYGEMLGNNCINGKILGGEIVYERLSESDKAGLERFYESIGLSENEKAERKKPRTLLDKKQVWEFTEEIIRLLPKSPSC